MPPNTAYQWQAAATLGQFTNIPGATQPQYNLARTPRPAYVRMLVTLTDPWDGTTALTTAPITINQPPQGLLWLENNNSPITAGMTIRAITIGIQDPNGGQIRDYYWQVNGTVQQTTTEPEWEVPAPLVPALAAGNPVAVAARYEDALGWRATVTTARNFNQRRELTVEITGPPAFAPGNVYTAVLATSAPAGGTPAPEVSINYQWGFEATEIRRAPDVAGKIVVEEVRQPFAPIAGATAAVYTMQAPELTGRRNLQVLVQQATAPGLMIGTQARLAGINAPVTGTVALAVTGVSVGAVARVSGTLQDNNGLVATLWAWESAPEPTFQTPRLLTRATAAQYTLQRDELAGNEYLRARLGGRDSAGAITWITTAPHRINYPPVGQLKLRTVSASNGQITFVADFSGLSDPNGALRVVRQSWTSPESTLTLLLSGYVVGSAAAPAVRYVAEVEDALGFRATVTIAQSPATVPRPLEKIIPALALETARAAQSALNRHLGHKDKGSRARWEINELPLQELEELSQVLRGSNNKFHSGAAAVTTPDLSWTFWADKSYQEITSGKKAPTFTGEQDLWLAGGERRWGKQRWGLALGQERVKLKTNWAGDRPEEFTQKLNIALPYWEYQPNPQWNLRGVLGYGTGKVKFTDQDKVHQAALAWQMAGLQTTYETDTESPLSARIGLGLNATRSKTGQFRSGTQPLPALNGAFAYELQATWENGYQLTLGAGNRVRPFWTAAGRTQWGAATEALIIHGGGGVDWELPAPALTGRFHWERQLTENNLEVKNNFTFGLQKQLTQDKHITWSGQAAAPEPWTQELFFQHEIRWQANTVIKEFNFNDDLTLRGKLIIKFE